MGMNRLFLCCPCFSFGKQDRGGLHEALQSTRSLSESAEPTTHTAKLVSVAPKSAPIPLGLDEPGSSKTFFKVLQPNVAAAIPLTPKKKVAPLSLENLELASSSPVRSSSDKLTVHIKPKTGKLLKVVDSASVHEKHEKEQSLRDPLNVSRFPDSGDMEPSPKTPKGVGKAAPVSAPLPSQTNSLVTVEEKSRLNRILNSDSDEELPIEHKIISTFKSKRSDEAETKVSSSPEDSKPKSMKSDYDYATLEPKTSEPSQDKTIAPKSITETHFPEPTTEIPPEQRYSDGLSHQFRPGTLVKPDPLVTEVTEELDAPVKARARSQDIIPPQHRSGSTSPIIIDGREISAFPDEDTEEKDSSGIGSKIGKKIGLTPRAKHHKKSVTGNWEKDSASMRCRVCNDVFTWKKTRHHCRNW
jgi:hypothetical protein